MKNMPTDDAVDCSVPRRRVSRFCLTPHALLLISSILYFSPYLLQSLESIDAYLYLPHLSYSSEVGWAVLFILFLLVVVAFTAPAKEQALCISSEHRFEAHVIFVTMILLGIYVISSGHLSQTNKHDMLNQTTRFHLFFYQVCALGLIFTVLTGIQNHLSLFLLSLAGLLLVIFIGHRSSFALALIGVFYIKYRNHPMTRETLKVVLLAGAVLFALSVYKSIYTAVKAGNWELVMTRLSPENVFQSAFVGMEQFVTFAHLDFLVRNDFRLECSNIWFIPVSIIPFGEVFIDAFDRAHCYYNAQVQPIFFRGYSGGVAANIWAEFFGYFGYLGFPILITVLSAAFWLLEFVMRHVRSPVLLSGLIMALVYMAFYIQRKELFGAFISAKRAILVALIVYFIAWFLRKLPVKQRGYI